MRAYTFRYRLGMRPLLRSSNRRNPSRLISEIAGSMVQEEGGVRFVELKRHAKVPLRSELQPLETQEEA